MEPYNLASHWLDRYLAGDATPEEHAAVVAWLDADPGRRAYYEALRWGARPRVRVSSEAVAHARQRILGAPQHTLEPSAAGIGRLAERKRLPLRPRLLRPQTWYTVASVVVIFAAIVTGWRAAFGRVARSKASPMLVYATGNGQRANITLSDGSTVSLNVASRLEVPADYLLGNHALRLSGEALFTVSHHSGGPFTVTTDQATTRVLGTSFVVRHYATDTMTMVAVRDGKVMVHSFVVPAARQVEVGPAGVVRTQHVDPARFSFASGVLILNSVSLSAAIVELNRWYDADIRLGDPALATQRLTGEYMVGSVADLANILALTFNVRVVRDGKILTLYAR